MTLMESRTSVAGVCEQNLTYIDQHIQRYIDAGKIAGALTAVYRNGETAHFSPLGLADRERNVPMADDTLFRIYSMSKPITSVAFMQLYERGLVHGDALVRGAMTMAYDACVQPFEQRFGHLLSPEFMEKAPALGRGVIAQLDKFADHPLTLTHGDYRLDNMFFSRDGNRPVILCDWQSPNRSWGIYDVAYFIAGGLDVEARRLHEDELVRDYHATLTSEGIDYSLEALREDYRACILVMAGIGVINGATLPVNNERGVQVFEKMMSRFQSAMTDLHALDLVE